MNLLMNPVGSKAEGKLNCINAVVITHLRRRDSNLVSSTKDLRNPASAFADTGFQNK